MRIARVIGKITLNKKLVEVQPGSYLIVRTCNRGTLAGKNRGNDEELVMFDNLGVSLQHVLGAGCVAGIGFTVSLFVADLSFRGARLSDAKVGIVAYA